MYQTYETNKPTKTIQTLWFRRSTPIDALDFVCNLREMMMLMEVTAAKWNQSTFPTSRSFFWSTWTSKSHVFTTSRKIWQFPTVRPHYVKNKMKPTNPNADTHEWSPRTRMLTRTSMLKNKDETYLSHFPANPLVGHPDLTRWGDTLVGHPCLTLLRSAQKDTLAWHCCKTLLLDTLLRHSYLTLLWDTLTWHSCKTFLLDTLVRLVRHSYLKLLRDTLVRRSYLTILTWHSYKTLWPDTLVRHSYLTLLSDTLAWHSCKTLLRDALFWHSSGAPLPDTLVRHSYVTLL